MKADTITPKPEVLRSDLIERVQRLDAESVLVLHRVMLEIEKQRLWKEISEEAAADHRAGLFDQLPVLLREARESLRQGA